MHLSIFDRISGRRREIANKATKLSDALARTDIQYIREKLGLGPGNGLSHQDRINFVKQYPEIADRIIVRDYNRRMKAYGQKPE